MCRETLGETEGAPNLDTMLMSAVEFQSGHFRTDGEAASSQPSRLWHICQMMQMERRNLMETLQDVCRQCRIELDVEAPPAEGSASSCEAASGSATRPASPRTLITRLCDAHLAMRARLDAAPEVAKAVHAISETEVQASPRDDISLQFSVTPASPPDGILLDTDSPWPVSSAAFSSFKAASLDISSFTPREIAGTQSSMGQSSSLGQPPSLGQPTTVGAVPAVGRLHELVDEKQHEVADLTSKCSAAATEEEHARISADLAAAREELRLLKEFLGEGNSTAASQ
jgi:hypothetical protein